MNKRTKAAYAIGLLGLLALGSGLRDRLTLADLRDEHRSLVARAESLGIHPDTQPGPIRTKVSKRFMESTVAGAGTTERLVSLISSIQRARHRGDGESLKAQEADLEIRKAVLKMPTGRFRAFIDELTHQDAIDDSIRKEFVSFALDTLRENNFGEYLNICLDIGERLEGHATNAAFADWAKLDPDAAVAWLKENQGKRPGIVNDDTKSALISSLAESDPAKAFRILPDLSLERESLYPEHITFRAKTPELRTVTLNALRDYFSTRHSAEGWETSERRAYFGLGFSLRYHGYEEAIAWLDGAGMSLQERDLLSEGLNYNSIRSDHSKWFGWMTRNLSADIANRQISSVISQWTGLDYEAAGKWLAGAPDDGLVKPIAVRAYVEAVAPFEPENAERWALTLPDGEPRRELFAGILRNWPTDDGKGKAAFALRHGL